MEIEEESKVVWQRIFPVENSISICPILMCPDDRDFSCTLVVAEIEHVDNRIKWKRLGLNKSQFYESDKVGSSVEWFKAFDEMVFDKSNYLQMLDTFNKDLLLKRGI